MDDKRKLLKLAEEASEVIQVVMKIRVKKGVQPNGDPEKHDLVEKLHSELGDMMAHVEALADSGYINLRKVSAYKRKKKDKCYPKLEADQSKPKSLG